MTFSTDLRFSNIKAKFDRGMRKRNQFKPLCRRIKSFVGRSYGRIVSPRRGRYLRFVHRFVDYKRSIFPNQKGLVLAIKYRPKPQVSISIICYPIGFFAHILTPKTVIAGKIVRNKTSHPINPGDSAIIANFSSGVLIHNIGFYPNSIGQLTRSAGCSTILVRKETDHVLLKLKSGELRYFKSSVIACSGVVGNESHFLRDYKRAGVKRRLGIRPRTRPSSMNPVDHPMGGRTRGGQPMNAKGIITSNRSTKRRRHPAILYTKRQMKFRRF